MTRLLYSSEEPRLDHSTLWEWEYAMLDLCSIGIGKTSFFYCIGSVRTRSFFFKEMVETRYFRSIQIVDVI